MMPFPAQYRALPERGRAAASILRISANAGQRFSRYFAAGRDISDFISPAVPRATPRRADVEMMPPMQAISTLRWLGSRQPRRDAHALMPALRASSAAPRHAAARR